jgi:hypothetical protein
MKAQNAPRTAQNHSPGVVGESFTSFAALVNRGLLAPDGNAHLRVERNFLISLMAQKVTTIRVDEEWYLARYTDVREAVRRGTVTSGQEHYVQCGYYEGRMPSAITVNEKWYLDTYADVADAIRRGVFKSGQAHFEQVGFREGRLPYLNFRL